MKELYSKLVENIYQSDFNRAMDAAEVLGQILWHNDLGIYQLKDVEQHLIDKARILTIQKVFPKQAEQSEKCLFLVSEPFMTGGHTRLMERLADMLQSPADLLISRSTSKNVLNRLGKSFSNITLCRKRTFEKYIDYIYELSSKISTYQSIVLNIHPDDIFLIVACGLAKKLNPSINLIFVNHSDHSFSFGSSISDMWLEISLYGRRIDDKRELKCSRSFLGIPLEMESRENIKIPNKVLLNDLKVMVTAGHEKKYKPKSYGSIFPLIKLFLKSNKDLTIHVIGPNIYTNYWWWILKIFYWRRLKIQKILPYDKYIYITSNSDLYIDSHPFPGGTAFVEQFLNGVDCAGLKSQFQGYTPLELVKKSTVQEVIAGTLVESHELKQEDIINKIIEVHSIESVRNRFLKSVFEGECFCNPMDKYLSLENDDMNETTKKIRVISLESFNFLLRNKGIIALLKDASLKCLLYALCLKVKRSIFS